MQVVGTVLCLTKTKANKTKPNQTKSSKKKKMETPRNPLSVFIG